MRFNNIINYKIIIVFLFLSATITSAANNINITSPNSNLEVEFALENGKAAYKISYNKNYIIDKSALGFMFKDSPAMDRNFSILDTSKTNFSETWSPVWGTEETILNEYNELTVSLKETTELQRIVKIIFRVYNDGVGFRYSFPEQPNMKDITIIDELTEFNLTDDHTCWWIPGDYDSYEYLYNKTKLSEIDLLPYNYETRSDRNHPNRKAVNTPITMETKEGLFLSFHEANLTDYAGMTLEVNENLTLKVNLVPWADGSKVKTSVPFETPWRTIQVSKTAGGLINSNLIVNLNEPNKLDDVSWIKPMKYVGIWWEMHIRKSSWTTEYKEGFWANSGNYHGANTENTKYYIDFASQNNIDAVLVEGWNKGWESLGSDTHEYFDYVTPYPDFNLEEVVKYAKEKGVELIGHHETAGQAASYEKHLEDAFKLYNKLGVRAVKTGYSGPINPKGEFHHGQYMVRHYRKVLETAAKYKIMIDVHEPIAATGLRRTFPNMMTREGVRGMEWNAWSDGNKPEHTTIIPFTRMLSGPVDYTPGIFDLLFDKYKDKERVHTTLAKQLALYIVLYSPMQMAADLPENYNGNPAFQFIKEVPVNWNESVFLNSKIGDYVTIARRNNDIWYLGSVSDEFARSVSVNLSFLDKDKIYKARIFRDGKDADWDKNPYNFEIVEQIVSNVDVLRIKLAKGGGQAIIFEPIDNPNE